MSQARLLSLILALNGLCLSCVWGFYYSLEVGDPCPTRDYRSSCVPSEDCKTLKEFFDSHKLSVDTVLNCGYTPKDEKICCPLLNDETYPRYTPVNRTSTTTTTTTSTTTTTITTSTTTTTTIAPPSWLSIFHTDRDYLQRSLATLEQPSTDSIVFPGRSTKVNTHCQAPLYEGTCLPTSRCESHEILLRQQRLRDEDVLSCIGGTTEEIICCPVSLPLQPRAQIGSAPRVGTGEDIEEQLVGSPVHDGQQLIEVRSIASNLIDHYKYLAALAYPNARFDGHLHRCTALLLSPQFLLTSAGCGRPSHAVFGVANMQDVDEEVDDLVDITNVSVYREDLALLRLPVSHQGAPAVICTSYEQTRWQNKGQLLAMGWARGNASDCALYELPMRLLPSSACKDIPNNGHVQDLPSRHLCVEPKDLQKLRATGDNACAPCPSVVGSVLHLQAANGRRCVLGVATPTGDDCRAEVMYFTSLIDRKLSKFIDDLRLNP